MEIRLGKKEAIPDERNLMLARFMRLPTLPKRHDLDKGRRPFPRSAWGNNAYGNCVKVGQAEQTLRLERIESRRTLKFTDADVIALYAEECERQFGCRPVTAGDNCDSGLYVLPSIRSWRTNGWNLRVGSQTRNFTIDAFGELVPSDHNQIKGAIYLLHGVQLGFWLPLTAQGQYDQWDIVENADPNSKRPGSWGGHLVYSKAYDEEGIWVKTWGMDTHVTWRFLDYYCDEAYAVVDSFNRWRRRDEIDVSGMVRQLREIGASGIEETER